MTLDACRDWRGALAASALGDADPVEELGLRAHLDGCAACRAELDELRQVAAVLPAADVAMVTADPEEPPAVLAAQVLGGVARERERQHARRRTRRLRHATEAAIALAAAVALVFGLTIGLRGSSAAHTNVVFTSTAGEGHATATLTERKQGTEVAFRVAGLHDGDWYWLWLTGDDGRRVPAGSFRGGAPAELELTAALPLSDTRRVWVTDDHDNVVFDAWLPSQQ